MLSSIYWHQLHCRTPEQWYLQRALLLLLSQTLDNEILHLIYCHVDARYWMLQQPTYSSLALRLLMISGRQLFCIYYFCSKPITGGFPFCLRPSQPGCRLSDTPSSVILVCCYTSLLHVAPDCRLQFSDFDRSTLPAPLYIGVVALMPLPLKLNLNYLRVCKVACRPEPDVIAHSYRYTVHVYYTTIYTQTSIVRITSSLSSFPKS